MLKRFNNVEVTHCKISELFPVEKVRLARGLDNDKQGVTEFPLQFTLQEPFCKELSFQVPWDREVFGFLRQKDDLFAKLGVDDVIKATIIDWEDTFILVFENAQGVQKPIYSTHRNCVAALLEGAMRPPSLVE